MTDKLVDRPALALRLATAVAITGVLVLVSACSAPGPGTSPASTTDASAAPSGTPVAAADAEEVFSPLILRPIAADPVPVPMTDGRSHIVYELEVQNASPRPATIRKVETLDGESDAVLATIEGEQVTALSMVVGDYALPPVPADVVPPGRSVLLVLEVAVDDAASAPATLEHRVTATFGKFEPNQGDFATNNFPAKATETGGIVAVATGEPEVIGPPMTGGGWVAVNGCCGLSPHRGAMLPIGGRINGSERYGVDWSRFDTDAKPLVDLDTGTQATFSGDPDDNASYYTFGQPALAVADAEVVSVENDLEDAPPHVFLTLPVKDLGGNRVVLKIRDGVYAFYAHLKKGSVSVQVGDRVTRGQQIAELGNSGNTSEAHAHFHLMDGPLPLAATNLPWVIDRFEYEGLAGPEGLDTSGAGPRENELPGMYSTIGFPEGG